MSALKPLPDEICQQLSTVAPPAENSPTLPPACYTDLAVLEAEKRSIFRKSWLGLGRADRWPSRGDFSALDIAGVPVIILRNTEGDLCAFANTCRHRSSLLLEGDGNVDVIRCPFHGWTYRLDGKLAAAPRMDAAVNFEKDSFGLMPFRVSTHDGFAFICLDDKAADLALWLEDFSNLHRPWQPAELVSGRRREFEAKCNWKAFLEVFNEYYHLPYVHPETLSSLYKEPDKIDVVAGNFVSQFGATRASSGILESARDHAFAPMSSLDGQHRHGTRYTWVFPNMTFAAGSEMIWIYEVFPIAPDRTRVGMTACFTREVMDLPDFERRARYYYERLDIAIEEDIPALERQHEGMSSPFARPGRFSALEPSVAGFAFWYARTMTTSVL